MVEGVRPPADDARRVWVLANKGGSAIGLWLPHDQLWMIHGSFHTPVMVERMGMKVAEPGGDYIGRCDCA